MDEDLLRRSLANLEQELQGLDSQLTGLRKLNDKREKIHALVTQMRFLLGLGPYTPPTPDAPPAPDSITLQPAPARFTITGGQPSISFRKASMWECAKEILRQADRPLELMEIVEALKGFNFKLDGRPGKETVRAILYKKSELFEKLSDGKYRLK